MSDTTPSTSVEMPIPKKARKEKEVARKEYLVLMKTGQNSDVEVLMPPKLPLNELLTIYSRIADEARKPTRVNYYTPAEFVTRDSWTAEALWFDDMDIIIMWGHMEK